MARIIFVGYHFKPGKRALCPSTKSGKAVSQICNRLGLGHEFLRTNLFNMTRPPKIDEIPEQVNQWYNKVLVKPGDIIVLFGIDTQRAYPEGDYPGKIIKAVDPSFPFFEKDQEKYISEIVELINRLKDDAI